MATHRVLNGRQDWKKAALAAVLPLAIAYVPRLRKKYGMGLFSIPSLLLFGGTWYLERRLSKM